MRNTLSKVDVAEWLIKDHDSIMNVIKGRIPSTVFHTVYTECIKHFGADYIETTNILDDDAIAALIRDTYIKEILNEQH